MRSLLSYCLFVLALAGCSAGGDAPSTQSGIASVKVENVGALDSARAQYVLWLRQSGTWRGYAMGTGTFLRATIPNVLNIDSAKLSIESRTVPANPTSVLVAEKLVGDHATMRSVLPDLSNASATAMLANHDGDTVRAKQELYLMRITNRTASASIERMPQPPSGWRYGLWVINRNFVPTQNLFFGSFVSPTGASTDAFATSYDFPGGYFPGSFLSEGSSVEVTLEPAANFSPRPRTPTLSLFTGQLHRWLTMYDSIPTSNVWQEPSADLLIQ